MRAALVTAVVGVIVGGVLSLAQYYSPSLLPWVVGFMLASLAYNVRVLTNSF